MIRRALFICACIVSVTACVRVDAAEWVDFLQMGRLNDQRQIVNGLWEKRQP